MLVSNKFSYAPILKYNSAQIKQSNVSIEKPSISTISPPSFGKRNTSKGDFLRYLENIRDPYSGCVMIPDYKMPKILGQINQAKTSPDKLATLSQYEDSMLPLEKEVYGMLCEGLDENPETTFREILSSRFEDSLENLKNKDTQSTVRNDMDSFIVKYHNCSDKSIAKRLISQSLSTVEHIKPDSLGGKNFAGNFILASKGRNSERGNMPIEEFIAKYPDIPQHTQDYMDDIIDSAHQGKLRTNEWYPYVIKDSLKDDMNIDVDVSRYKISSEDAFVNAPQKIKNNYSHYSKPNKIDFIA